MINQVMNAPDVSRRIIGYTAGEFLNLAMMNDGKVNSRNDLGFYGSTIPINTAIAYTWIQDFDLTINLTQLRMAVTGAGSLIYAGYSVDLATRKPKTKLWTSNVINTNTAGDQTTSISVTYRRGGVYCVVMNNGVELASAAVRPMLCATSAGSTTYPLPHVEGTASGAASPNLMWTVARTYDGTLPDDISGLSWAGSRSYALPGFLFRKA